MHLLHSSQLLQVSAGMASMSLGSSGIFFTTTDKSVNRQAGKINDIQFGMIMYSDHITDLNNNTIFAGNSGTFCHLGTNFLVSPVTNGIRVNVTGSC